MAIEINGKDKTAEVLSAQMPVEAECTLHLSGKHINLLAQEVNVGVTLKSCAVEVNEVKKNMCAENIREREEKEKIGEYLRHSINGTWFMVKI